MKWTIPELNRLKKQRTFSFHEKIDVSDSRKQNPEIRRISEVDVNGVGEFSYNQVTFTLHITATVVLPCAMTLEDVPYPLSIDTVEMFQLSTQEVREDGDIHPIVGEVLDLTPYIKENILLALPMRVVSEHASETMQKSGEGWEVVTEESQKNKIDPRLADLAKFFENKE
ncbi:YceD family protein [Massilibacterium senegalense]|uniref:YceD family protein n=1 Tax=Massilibacterium senegalense TaxID=1632858 RepID=UPI000781295F|nr:YceD family protein [Massilibacterium senegalense]